MRPSLENAVGFRRRFATTRSFFRAYDLHMTYIFENALFCLIHSLLGLYGHTSHPASLVPKTPKSTLVFSEFKNCKTKNSENYRASQPFFLVYHQLPQSSPTCRGRALSQVGRIDIIRRAMSPHTDTRFLPELERLISNTH